MTRLQLIGSNLRGVLATTLCSPADRIMRAAIERLNEVSDSVIAQHRDARETAIDDTTEAR